MNGRTALMRQTEKKVKKLKVKVRRKNCLKKHIQVHVSNNDTELKKQAKKLRRTMLESLKPLPFLTGDEISPFDRRFF